MNGRIRRLSKSRFCSGLQCEKLLWWSTHEPGAPELEPDAGRQILFEQGREVGALARTYVPGGVQPDLEYDDYDGRIAAAKATIGSGARVLYEAGFAADGVFVAADILERGESGWTLVEVKSTNSVKDEHVPDVAVQVHVLRAAGLAVRRAEVMHLNRACVFPDLSNLFVREDVTARVESFLPGVPARLARLLAAVDGPLPAVPIGPHCTDPYECPFRPRCWKDVPGDHVTTLYHAGRKAWDWIASGHETIGDLPASLPLGAPAQRQRRSLRERRRIVEPGLARALAAFRPPLAVLDFETVNPAIPRWRGCSPYTQVPVQFSVQRRENGAWRETGWIAARGADPRPACAEALLAACEGARTVLAYNVSFERQCVRHLAGALPRLAGPLAALDARLADLLPAVRDHVYDPAFGGSFSIKGVLPAIVGGDGYAALAIADGMAASRELARLLLAPGAPAPDDDARTRSSLREYCALDTRAVVELLEALARLEPSG